MLLGCHVSISGGYDNAAIAAGKLGMDAIQIFTKNQRFWREKVVSDEEAASFRQACKVHGVKQVFSHSIYLISMGTANEDIADKSMLSLAMELERCKKLGLTHTVLHPGHAGDRPLEDAIALIAGRIKQVISVSKNNSVKILLENTAGGGSSVGGKLENIAALVKAIRSKRVGVCIDTCHAFAAGYDIRTLSGTKKFFADFDRLIGLDRLLCFHLNDSKGDLGSKIDRHTSIGEGKIGTVPFEYIMRNFAHIPKVFELSPEGGTDRKNLQLLRSFGRKK